MAEVVVLRGIAASPWDLAQFAELERRGNHRVTVAVSPANEFDPSTLPISQVKVRTVSSLLPRGPLRRLGTRAVGERFISLDKALAGAEIVHSAEIGNWYTAQAAKLKRNHDYRLVTTCWETLPLMDSYRNVRTRPYRWLSLEATDHFLPTSEIARNALLLEGASPERMTVCPPGVAPLEIDSAGRQPENAQRIFLSIGRLVWDKGHQDAIRALALARKTTGEDLRLVIVGTGPEETTLRSLAADLGLIEVVDFRGWIPHEETGPLYRQASALVLASLPTRFWEEQFGMVLGEAMQAGVPVIASTSGAIPEVVGDNGTLFSPGDWVRLATLFEGALPPPQAGSSDFAFTLPNAAERLETVYERVLAS